MIEVAFEILQLEKDVMAFAEIVNKIQNYLDKTDEEIRNSLTQFYTDLNTDGRYICLGDNRWGLRSWYPFESIDEALVQAEADEENDSRKKHQKVNAFLADVDEDDANIDIVELVEYSNDSSEFDDDEDDDDSELKAYSKDLDNIDDEDEEELPDGIEGQLTEIVDEDLEEDEF